MYEFITHTGNAIKGKCYHDCSYCYMKKWGEQKPVRLDRGELSVPLTNGNFIFVGSSCDMFANEINPDWIADVLDYCIASDNKFLWQTKNPEEFHHWNFPIESVFCTTIETNRLYPDIMRNSPIPQERAKYMNRLNEKKYVTIEPIMDFDTDELFELIAMCKPKQVNIGADSGNNNLPEPSFEKVMVLIEMLKGITTVHKKKNLNRLLTT